LAMLESPLVRKLIDLAIEEDLSGGDLTAELSIDKERLAQAEFVAREELILCGVPVVTEIFKRFGIHFELLGGAEEGLKVASETVFMRASGSARELISIERTCLNFLQRMSGVATNTAKVMSHKPQNVVLLDTRKTVPGWRVLDKYAVKIGGGQNHRVNLSDMIMVKDNHIDSNGGDLAAVLERVMRDRPPKIPVEVEVRNSAELEVALGFNPEIIMLDNFPFDKLEESINLIRSKAKDTKIEISGRILPETLVNYSSFGQIYISIGALTTSVRSVDISLNIKSL